MLNASRQSSESPDPAWSGWIPVRITGGDPTSGYTFVERWNTAGGVPEDKGGGRPAEVLNPAFAVVSGQMFAVGDIALARPAPGAGAGEWELVPTPQAVAADRDPGSPSACAWLAGLNENSCLTASVRAGSQAGLCSEIPTQSVELEYSGGVYVSAADFVTDVLTGPLEFDPGVGSANPSLTLDGTYVFRFLGCIDGCLAFAGGGSAVCSEGDTAECADSFVVLVCCGCTPAELIPDAECVGCDAGTVPRYVRYTLSGPFGVAAFNGEDYGYIPLTGVLEFFPGTSNCTWTGYFYYPDGKAVTVTYTPESGGGGVVSVSTVDGLPALTEIVSVGTDCCDSTGRTYPFEAEYVTDWAAPASVSIEMLCPE